MIATIIRPRRQFHPARKRHIKPARNLFKEGAADILRIDPLAMRGYLSKTLCGRDLWVSGYYRKNGDYYHFTVNINTGHIHRNEKK